MFRRKQRPEAHDRTDRRIRRSGKMGILPGGLGRSPTAGAHRVHPPEGLPSVWMHGTPLVQMLHHEHQKQDDSSPGPLEGICRKQTSMRAEGRTDSGCQGTKDLGSRSNGRRTSQPTPLVGKRLRGGFLKGQRIRLDPKTSYIVCGTGQRGKRSQGPMEGTRPKKP